MTAYTIESNKTHGKHCVLTAKSSPEVFVSVEYFRGKAQLNSRNDAINVLIAIGLFTLGEMPSEAVKEYTAKYKFDFNPSEVMK